MSWYKEYKEEWTEIIETVAAEEHRQTQMIEKDTTNFQRVSYHLYLRAVLRCPRHMD